MTDSAARTRNARPIWVKLVFGVTFSLFLLEGLLQGARYVNRNWIHPMTFGDSEGREQKVIVCVGDSHTWGWGVHPHLSSYPVRLQQLLNQGDPHGPYRVENLGFPGFNTEQVRDRLERRLQGPRPDLVLVLAGFNNSWNPAQVEDGGLWDALVIPRLVKLLTAGNQGFQEAPGTVVLEGDQPFVLQEDGTRMPIRDSGAQEGLVRGESLRDDVEAGIHEIIQLCRQESVTLLLQTYASDQSEVFRLVSAGIRLAAQQPWPTAVIDHRRWFQERALSPETALQPDGHPSALGYQAMADSVNHFLRNQAGFEHWVFPDATEASTSPPTEGVSLSLGAPNQEEDAEFTLTLQGPANGVFQVSVAASQQEGPFGLAIAQDDWFSLCQGAVGLSGHLDAQGRGVAYLYPAIYQPFPREQELFVQALLLNPHTTVADELVLAASEVRTVQLPAEQP